VTRQQSAEQAERRRARDRTNKARARLRAKGLDPDEAPSPSPACRRVVLPVSRAGGSGWQDRAACRSEPPEWFDAETGENAARALAVCAGCPVRRECFAAAAADRAASGVWGGVDLSAPHRQAVAS
jgi:WhiB family transcriptional regulator, redox-sensing transcriptional regulator